MNKTHLSLFSGIGGLDIAAEWAGFQTVGQCEWADYPTEVLEKHWPDVPRWRDIRALTGGDFYARTGVRQMRANGYSRSIIADQLRISVGLIRGAERKAPANVVTTGKGAQA